MKQKKKKIIIKKKEDGKLWGNNRNLVCTMSILSDAPEQPKGQLISKRNSQAEDSPKEQTNEVVFTSVRRVFVRFLGESSARKKSFRDYLAYMHTS